MKYLSVLVMTCLIICFNTSAASSAKAEGMIQGSVSMTDRVPQGFFGAWKVISVLADTNNKKMFAPYSVDIWNLSKMGDVITLSNPVSGAKASVTVNDVDGNTVKFKKTSYDTDEESIETPVLTLGNNGFSGIDRIEVKTFKNGELQKTEFVEYNVKAVKISGAAIPDIFGY